MGFIMYYIGKLPSETSLPLIISSEFFCQTLISLSIIGNYYLLKSVRVQVQSFYITEKYTKKKRFLFDESECAGEKLIYWCDFQVR